MSHQNGQIRLDLLLLTEDELIVAWKTIREMACSPLSSLCAIGDDDPPTVAVSPIANYYVARDVRGQDRSWDACQSALPPASEAGSPTCSGHFDRCELPDRETAGSWTNFRALRLAGTEGGVARRLKIDSESIVCECESRLYQGFQFVKRPSDLLFGSEPVGAFDGFESTDPVGAFVDFEPKRNSKYAGMLPGETELGSAGVHPNKG